MSNNLVYNRVIINRNDILVPITVYIPKSEKEALRKSRVSMSHLCRTAIVRYLHDKVRQSKRQKVRYHTEEEFKRDRLENARKQKKKL